MKASVASACRSRYLINAKVSTAGPAVSPNRLRTIVAPSAQSWTPPSPSVCSR